MSIKQSLQMAPSKPDDMVRDLLDLLQLAIKRTSDKLTQLDQPSLNSGDRKELLQEISQHI